MLSVELKYRSMCDNLQVIHGTTHIEAIDPRFDRMGSFVRTRIEPFASSSTPVFFS